MFSHNGHVFQKKIGHIRKAIRRSVMQSSFQDAVLFKFFRLIVSNVDARRSPSVKKVDVLVYPLLLWPVLRNNSGSCLILPHRPFRHLLKKLYYIRGGVAQRVSFGISVRVSF